MHKHPANKLVNSSSPYLLQHAYNPVHWQPWSPDALKEAVNRDVPIILSIGYSSCHWCHVMERESFENEELAEIMNQNFVCIKVDREERPDIDQVYITAAQLISGNAGWPLNAFALPNGKPFYAATYFTKDQWIKLLTQILNAYREDNSNIVRQADAITRGILEHELIQPAIENKKHNNSDVYNHIVSKWEPSFDYKLGGLSGAPKFPMPVVWEFLLQDYYQTKNPQALNAVTITLNEMAKGGIYDH